MCEIKMHVKCPIFVARQWFRHRTGSYNEVSARYREVWGDFYLPHDRLSALLTNQIMFSIEDNLERYRNLLDYGVPKELARIVLPQAMYTEFYWKIDLRNLFNFLKLRHSEHAQYEIREYARHIEEFVASWVPVSYMAFKGVD
jgi:thymidylate synthase (FAD)